MLGDVVFCVVVWLFVAAFATLLLGDMTNYPYSFTELFARAVLWPVVLPVLLVKGVFFLLKFMVSVANEIPNALRDLWRLK